MAGPVLQLFPPPQRVRQTSPSRSPTSRKLRVKTSTPEPPSATEKMESAKSMKAPGDFHELIIQVNSVPVSPTASVTAPPRAHIPNSGMVRTPPQESIPTFDSPSRPRAASSSLNRKVSQRYQDPRAPSPSYSVQQRSLNASPEPNRAASPAVSEAKSTFSASPTLVRANSTATHVTSRSPQEEVPMRSIFPVYDPTVPLARQQYKPTQASPTHIPRTQISRSPYSPEFYIPHRNIAAHGGSTSPPPKPFFTPSHLLDNMWVACNGQEEPVVQMYTLRMHRATATNPAITFGPTPSLPFYSLSQANLAGEHEVPSIVHEVLIQRHHPTQPRALPIAHLDLIAPPSMEMNTFDPHQQEPTTLLTSIYPKLAALAALDAAANSPAASQIALADPGAQSPAAERLAQDVLFGSAQRECCALAWCRDSPSSSGQTNPWAHAMPSEGSYQLHHPTLGTFPIQIEGDCSVINKPSTRPMTAIYGHNMPSTPNLSGQKPATITLLNPYILSPTSPRANSFNSFPPPPPPRVDSLGIGSRRPISVTPSEMDSSQLATTTDAVPDDAVLAKLDFSNDALTLNLGALTRFGNPFLADVAASTLLAVGVAEAVRKRDKKRSQESFEPPPPSSLLNGKKEPSTAKAFKGAFVEGFESWGGPLPKVVKKKSEKWSLKSLSSSSHTHSFDKDIEMGEWYGQGRNKETKDKKDKKSKKNEEDDGLPFITRSIIGLLTFAFKAVVFVLRISIKVVAGVIVMITRNFSFRKESVISRSPLCTSGVIVHQFQYIERNPLMNRSLCTDRCLSDLEKSLMELDTTGNGTCASISSANQSNRDVKSIKMMRRKSTYTNITPIPSFIPRKLAIDILHSHSEIIELNPLVLSHEPIKAPRDAPSDEYYSTWYEITQRIQYIPGAGKLGSGKIKFKGCFHDMSWGLQTHIYAPAGVDLRNKWRICGNQLGEPPETRELGIGAPAEGLYLREDIEIRCNFSMVSFVKKETKAASKVLVERLIKKAELLDSGVLQGMMEDGKLKTINPADRSQTLPPPGSPQPGFKQPYQLPMAQFQSPTLPHAQHAPLPTPPPPSNEVIMELPGDFYHPQPSPNYLQPPNRYSSASDATGSPHFSDGRWSTDYQSSVDSRPSSYASEPMRSPGIDQKGFAKASELPTMQETKEEHESARKRLEGQVPQQQYSQSQKYHYNPQDFVNTQQYSRPRNDRLHFRVG
ncbi:hypothetical protein GQ43DRAFT_427639 [Delitschia confertaspora ATCC 74209]|uniref:DUF7053 domain-containing protein n=1 Tax=Delitschia confertaspora ATCC 74209 TaxID=1513339 RepID=A0A9P4N3P5_9PLEO|nr:hypothetical protein GQ43DRAFT_427639 [Delitschia confertaspora ATCC 74209]